MNIPRITTSAIPALALLLAALLVAACGGGGGGGGGNKGSSGGTPPVQPGQMRLDAADVVGATDEAARVTVGGQADGDGAVDRAFTVRRPLTDPGATGTRSHDWEIVATDGAGNAQRRRIAVVLNP